MSETLVVPYVSKSTTDNNDSLDSQWREIHEYVERQQGWQLVCDEPFSDEDKSAYSGSRGPGLVAAKKFAADLAKGHEDVRLLVFASDRLARGDGKKARHLSQLWFEAQDAGYQLAAINENLGDLLYATLLGERNTQDSKIKGAHIARGRREHVMKGRKAGGSRPFGYQSVRVGYDDVKKKPITELHQVPHEIAAVRQMFELTVSGVAQGEIARRLNKAGVRTPATKQHPEGCEITQARISTILRSRLYFGEVVNNGDWFPGNHEAAVSPELFDEVAAILAANRRGAVRDRGGRRGREEFLLGKGLLRCECGHAMRVNRERRPGRSPIDKYRCLGRQSGATDCTMGQVERSSIETAVWEYFELIGLDSKASLDHARRSTELARETLRDQITAQERVIKDAEAALAKADASFTELDTSVYNRLIKLQSKRLKAAENDLHRLRQDEAGLMVNAVFDDSETRLRAQIELIRHSLAMAREDDTGIVDARAALTNVFTHFVLHRRDKPIHGVSVWIEPVPREEAVLTEPTVENPGYLGRSDGELRKTVLAVEQLTRQE